METYYWMSFTNKINWNNINYENWENVNSLFIPDYTFYFFFLFFNLFQKLSDSLILHTLSTSLYLLTKFYKVYVYNLALVFTLKLVLSIMFLILIRGGTPRYRYDYLTKLGWLKFFGLVITFFLTLLLVFFTF